MFSQTGKVFELEELYLEKFFKKKEESTCAVSSQKTLEVVEEKNLPAEASQLFFFLRLFKEDCQKYLAKAPYLTGVLKKLEDALEYGHYDQALVIMDEMEELLDIAHSVKP